MIIKFELTNQSGQIVTWSRNFIVEDCLTDEVMSLEKLRSEWAKRVGE